MNKGGTDHRRTNARSRAPHARFRHRPGVFVRGRQPSRSRRDLRTRWSSSAGSRASTRRQRSFCMSTRRSRGRARPSANIPGSRFRKRSTSGSSERWQSFALRRDPRTPWAPPSIRQRVRNFETVLNAYYPTTTDMRLTPVRRRLLRALSAWRYQDAHRGAALGAQRIAARVSLSAAGDDGFLGTRLIAAAES